MKLLDGKHLLKVEPKGPEAPGTGPGSGSGPRNQPLNGLLETGFIEYMDPGTWHLALYNDGKKMETVLILSTPIGKERGEKKRGERQKERKYERERVKEKEEACLEGNIQCNGKSREVTKKIGSH